MLRHEDFRALQGVHPLLSAVVIHCARSLVLVPHADVPRFRITSGKRSLSEQRSLVEAGKSQTLRSKHRLGLAVDLAILSMDRSEAYWEFERYEALNKRMQHSGLQLGVELTWGGEWTTLRDGVHWEVDAAPTGS